MEPSQALRVSFELKDLIISLLERLGLCEHSGQKDRSTNGPFSKDIHFVF